MWHTTSKSTLLTRLKVILRNNCVWKEKAKGEPTKLLQVDGSYEVALHGDLVRGTKINEDVE